MLLFLPSSLPLHVVQAPPPTPYTHASLSAFGAFSCPVDKLVRWLFSTNVFFGDKISKRASCMSCVSAGRFPR